MATAGSPSSSWRTRRLVLAAVSIVLTLLTVQLALGLRAPAPLPVLYTLGGDFEMPSTLGEPLSTADLRGRIVLLNFGYSGCPDVCPTVLARLRAVLLDLEALQVPAQALFVTLDPDRDDLSTLARYLGHFHPALVGLRGSDAATAAAARRYHVLYERRAGADPSAYLLDHSVHIYLIDPAGRVRATFGPDVPVADMVRTVRRLHARPGDTR